MASPKRTVGIDDVRALALDAFLPRASGTIGAEIEWIVFAKGDVTRCVSVNETRAAVGSVPLPAGGVVTFEPGGQLELSSAVAPSPEALLAAVDTDVTELTWRMERAGLRLADIGLDPHRPPVRTLHLPRYDAMETAFDARGSEGRIMMCSTASLQINVDFGPDPWRSWRDAAMYAPVLAAMFANSPRYNGADTGSAGTRQKVWTHIDPTRTRPVPTASHDDWCTYLLQAQVLLVRTADGGAAGVTDNSTLHQWIEDGNHHGYPDASDVAYHATTLFPPIRPRRWMEFRMIDAIPRRARRVAIAVAWALTSDPVAGAAAAAACGSLIDPWSAAQSGLSQGPMRDAAVTCLQLAARSLSPRHQPLADETLSWCADFTGRGRTPADDYQEPGRDLR